MSDKSTNQGNYSNPYRRKFFDAGNIVSVILLVIGILASLYVFIIQQELFKALGLLVIIVWACLFIRYFVWAVYFYNINYGWTDKDWDRHFDAKRRKQKNLPYNEEDLEAPKFNPYRSQTFGLPIGTVRGMITLTLLFGAVGLLIASFGADSELSHDSFFWDHFEFFKTAFLMMIAFYFGDRSLKTLQKRWNASREGDYLRYKLAAGHQQSQNSGSPTSDLDQDDLDYQIDNQPPATVVNTPQSVPNAPAVLTSVSDFKTVLARSEAEPAKPIGGLIPIIDAGHGGLDENGKYLCLAGGKQYQFVGSDHIEDTHVYEGVINRAIGKKLIELLKENGIPYKEFTVNNVQDLTLRKRVELANKEFPANRNYYFMSIHSNASGIVASPGLGSPKAKGFEVFTSRGETKSDALADIAIKWYKKEFPDFRFRQDMVDGDADKEENFYVLRKTACPAFLVENLFFDNPIEAEFLMSESGQMRIAKCLFNVVREIYGTQSHGLYV